MIKQKEDESDRFMFPIKTSVPQSNSIDGIFTKIKNSGRNPLFFINVSNVDGCITLQKPEYIVLGTNDFQTYGSVANILFDFKKFLIIPTNYTFRGTTSYHWSYQTEWEVFGFNEYNKNDKEKWTKLGKRKSQGTNFCGTDTFCSQTGEYATFSVDNPKRLAFRYIKFVTINLSFPPNIVFSVKFLEMFGKLAYSHTFNYQNIQQKYLKIIVLLLVIALTSCS